MKHLIFILFCFLSVNLFGQVDPDSQPEILTPVGSDKVYTQTRGALKSLRLDTLKSVFMGTDYLTTALSFTPDTASVALLPDSLRNRFVVGSDLNVYYIDGDRDVFTVPAASVPQTLSIDSTGRVFAISLTNGGSVKFKDTDTQLSQEQVEDYAGGLVTGNTETGISVTYQTSDNTLDFAVDVTGDWTGTLDTYEASALLALTNATGTLDEANIDADIARDSEIPTVSDVAYNATTWDANTDAATKNAIRDKIETLAGGHDAVTLAGKDYLTLSSQEITANQIDLTDDVTGVLPAGNIGTHNHATTDVNSGTFADARISESNVTQHEGAIDHDALTNFTTNEHFLQSAISIPLSQGANDVTATSSEVNLLDLSGLTDGWVLSATGAATASWSKLNASDLNNDSGFLTSVSAHASTHIRGGTDEIDGDKIDIDWTPSNYTPTTSPSQADNLDHLTAHLAGIDTELAQGVGIWGTPSQNDIAVWHSTTEIDGHTELTWDGVQMRINTTNGAADASRPLLVQSESLPRFERYSNNASSAGLLVYKARGTGASPADIQVNDGVLTLNGNGYANGAFRGAGNITFEIEGISGSNLDTRIGMKTMEGGVRNERLRITSEGYIGLSTISPQTYLHISADNTSTTPTQEIEQLSTGDAGLQFSISGDSYAAGIDNSDGDKFKISYSSSAGGAVLGTNDIFELDANGGILTGDFQATAELRDSDADPGAAGDIFVSTGTGTNWETKSYGEMYVDDAAPIDITITSGTPAEGTGYTVGLLSNFSYSLGRLTYTGTRTIKVLINTSISFSHDTNNTIVEAWIYENGAEVSKSELHRKVGTGGDIGNAGQTCILELATNDYIEIFFDASNSGDVTIENANINITQI